MRNKWYMKIMLILLLSIVLKSKSYGISSNFKFVIDTIGVPQYNVNREEINEEVYYTYNIFAYGSPNSLGWHPNQRFKGVPSMGKWTRSNGSYKGYGERGEYELLGTGYSGSLISNVYFPVDGIPETTPNNWNFIATPGAYESWFDRSKYKYDDQINYMKSTGLLFDEINYSVGSINPYNLVSYGVTVNRFGMDKFTLDTASTWKTNGVVTARRMNNLGQIRYAFFATAPMAASANVKAGLNVLDSYTLDQDSDEITIPITISANAVNLNSYARKEHIKEIVSILYINDKEVARVSGSKIQNVDKKISFRISRNDYPDSKTYPLSVKVLSYLYTEFNVDGLMQDEIRKEVKINVEEKRVIPIQSIELSTLEMDNEHLVVRPLIQTNITKSANSKGIVEAGKYITLKLEKNVDDVDIECYINDNKVDYRLIKENNRYKVIEIKLDMNLANTLNSWKYLRDKTNNYFDVDFNLVGERIKESNELKIISSAGMIDDKLTGTHDPDERPDAGKPIRPPKGRMVVVKEQFEDVIKFDSIDNYNDNSNFSFKNNVINLNEYSKTQSIEEWIK